MVPSVVSQHFICLSSMPKYAMVIYIQSLMLQFHTGPLLVFYGSNSGLRRFYFMITGPQSAAWQVRYATVSFLAQRLYGFLHKLLLFFICPPHPSLLPPQPRHLRCRGWVDYLSTASPVSECNLKHYTALLPRYNHS